MIAERPNRPRPQARGEGVDPREGRCWTGATKKEAKSYTEAKTTREPEKGAGGSAGEGPRPIRAIFRSEPGLYKPQQATSRIGQPTRTPPALTVELGTSTNGPGQMAGTSGQPETRTHPMKNQVANLHPEGLREAKFR